MKKTFLILATLVLFFASSCKKDKDETPKPSILGFWKGKYGNSTSYPSLGYAFLFRNNGTVRIFNNLDTAAAIKAEGTYTVSGTTVTTNYTYSTSLSYSTSATIDNNMTFQEGTWGNGTSTTDGGRFFIVKQ